MAEEEDSKVNIKELEQEVLLAELKMRKAEATVRLREATEKLRGIRSNKKPK